MSNEKYSTAIAGLASAAMDGAEMMIASLRKDRDDLSAELEVARKEIASLKERLQQLGQLTVLLVTAIATEGTDLKGDAA